MSDGYIQPYESLNSTAKLIRLPKKEQRSRSVGRNFWARLLTGSSSSSPHNSHPQTRRSESPSSTSCRSQNSTVIVHDSRQRSSRTSGRSSHSSLGQPRPRPRTSLSSNSISESDSNIPFNEPSTLESRISNTSFPKTKTTVTVHLRKANITCSTPNLVEINQFGKERKASESSNRCSTESLNWNRPIKEQKNSLSFGSFTNIDEPQTSQNSNFKTQKREESPHQQLNSLQVFRIPKYRERKKAERRIKQLEHLKQNSKCNELVNQLGKAMHPNTYENQNTLNLVNFINTDGFVTSSRREAPKMKHLPAKPKPKSPPIDKRNVFSRDHIYSEINEDHLKTFSEKNILKTPVFRKKVTFTTFHEPVLESDPFSQNKKILPAKFWGIVQVTEALRSRADEDRRRMAHLCYHAIVTGAEDHSLKFLGKVDNGKWGECVYVVLEERHFEIRDGDGLVIVKHGFNDVSVVTQIRDDPCLFVYIGRCKFNGRVGVTIRFNKSKHLSVVLNSFAKKK